MIDEPRIYCVIRETKYATTFCHAAHTKSYENPQTMTEAEANLTVIALSKQHPTELYYVRKLTPPTPVRRKSK